MSPNGGQQQRERASLPLAGLTVLDMTHVGAGPFCSSILGQLGADVIKLEGLSGDRMRTNEPRVGAGGIGYYFASVNLQKRFLQMDLKNPAAQEALKTIITSTDILVENFAPGVAERLGADYAGLKPHNERLIYCSIKGFRSGTEYGDLVSIDYVHEAMTGVMSMTRHPDEVPPLPGYPAADFSGALYGALAISVALRMRDATGLGQFIEVPLHDSLLSLLPLRLGYTFATGNAFPALGRYHRDFVPFGVFETADKPIIIACATERLWERFTQVAPAMKQPRYATMKDRLAAKEAFYVELEEILGAESADYWVDAFRRVGVPVAAVMSTDEVFRDRYVEDMLARLPVQDQEYAWIPYAPVHGAFSPVADRAPTEAGAHTREALSDLGLSVAEIDDLFARQAIAGA